MRNLKKILALVLALVMSLSLMATAGASKFPDVDAENPYATAIDVLDGLKVFQGFEDGTFKPTDTLNRAQAAVLVYRIATGDVENKYLDNYTFMQQSKFTDLDGYNWAKGYINYCQNAGIVVGTSATTFDPGAKVTGYQLLVMLLRTLGYGKAGEFADPKGWELQTATIAEREGITKNVTAGDFGAPAPRQMVAEILFRGLLSESVEYSALIPGGYTKTGVTLGMREFGLEQISGVVMANEWANLNDGAAGEKVLAAGTTQMKLEDGKTYTVNRSTDLDAVGLTYNAYIADGGENGTKRALTLEEGANTVAFNEGKAVATSSSDQSWTTLQKLADEESISINDNTEFFVNYSQAWNEDVTSEYLIRYAIAKNSATATWTEYLTGIFNDTKPVNGHTVIERTIAFNSNINADDDEAAGTTTLDCWVVAIRPGKLINTTDQAIMEKIFYTADRIGENTVNAGTAALRDYAIGEVYVGTTSMKDYSDDMSWNEFREEYFEDTLKSRRFATCEMGNSLRIVDNDGDGEAEYALKIAYTQAQAISGSADALILSDGLRMSKYTDNNLNVADELALDDVIDYYIIDGKLSAWKADMVNGTISDKSFQNITVTVTDGDTYGQSGIVNATRLDENILAMADKTEYNMYLDEFGYIRTYELAQGKQYALLTEIYPTSSQNWNYVTTHRYIAELQAGDEARTEYMVSNSSSDIFYSYNRGSSNNTWYNSGYVWTQIANLNGQGIGNTYYNYLQPAVAHLGYNRDDVYPTGNNLNNGATTANSYGDPIWGRTVYQMAVNSDAFNYGTPKAADGKPAGYQFNTQPGTPVDESFSYTNIALYTMDGDEVLLNTAAEKATDRTGAQLYRTVNPITALVPGGSNAAAYTVKNAAEWKIWFAANMSTATGVALDNAFNTWFYGLLNTGDMYEVYATDYVQLVNNQNYPAGNRHFTIAADYNTKYFTNSNTYVDAVDTTEFYIVGPTNVLHVVGYSNLPAIDASTIRAAYAVAKNTAKDQISRDYWVADVIVIEVNKITDDFDSISLMYYNPNENTNSVRYIKSLNDSWRSLQPDYADKAMMDVVPARSDVGSAVWGNHSWTARDYGFYFLYDTDLQSEGSMTAGNAVKVTNGQYNKNGIFAGTVSRVEDLYSSNYIDVVYTDGAGQQHKHITVNSSAYETPVYRISSSLGVTTAGEIKLDNDIRISDVQPGDQIIYVYKHGENGRQVAYIVDIARDINDDGIDENGIPAWLYAAVTGLWTDIDAEQRGTNVPEVIDNVNIDIVLAPGESATFKQTGYTDQTVSNPAAATEDVTRTATLKVPHTDNTMDFQVEVPATVALAAITPDGWRMTGASKAGNVYTIYMIRNDIPVAQTLADTEEAGTIYTVKVVENKLTKAAELAAKLDDGSATDSEKTEAITLLGTLTKINTTSNKVSDFTGTVATNLATAVNPATDGSLANEVTAIQATPAEKTTAKNAVKAIADQWPDDEGVKKAAAALTEAIDACVTKTELEAIYTANDGLKDTDAKVQALNAAVDAALLAQGEAAAKKELANKKTDACAKIDEMTKGLTGDGTNDVAKAANALKALINACVVGGVDGDKTVAATNIAKYWTGTALPSVTAEAENQTVAEKAIVALNKAIADAQATILAAAKTKAASDAAAYLTEATKDLTEAQKAEVTGAIAEAKETFDGLVVTNGGTADTQAAVNEALAAYKEAIDDAVATAKLTALSTVTVTLNTTGLKVGDTLPTATVTEGANVSIEWKKNDSKFTDATFDEATNTGPDSAVTWKVVVTVTPATGYRFADNATVKVGSDNMDEGDGSYTKTLTVTVGAAS